MGHRAAFGSGGAARDLLTSAVNIFLGARMVQSALSGSDENRMQGSGNWLLKLGVGFLVLYTLGFIVFAATLPRTPAVAPHADGIVARPGAL